MNRRSFLGKLSAGIAALPLVGKIEAATPAPPKPAPKSKVTLIALTGLIWGARPEDMTPRPIKAPFKFISARAKFRNTELARLIFKTEGGARIFYLCEKDGCWVADPQWEQGRNIKS